LGPIDIVVANAGVESFGLSWELTEKQWQDVIDVNLTGLWKTTTAVIPSMIDSGRGGSIILTSSIAGLIAYANMAHYNVAKHGVTGLMRTLAVELAPHNIRVNSVHPTVVNTPMINNPAVYEFLLPHLEDPKKSDVDDVFVHFHALRVAMIEPVDVSNAVLYFASDEARFVTGTTHVIDAGAMSPLKIPHQSDM